MTTTPRSPRLLLLSTILLAVAGIALLGVPQGQQPAAPTASPASRTSAGSSSSPSAAAAPAQLPLGRGASAVPAASAPSALQPALAPHGEGAAGDEVIQRSLQAAWPADLPATDERTLCTDGRALLRADATGIGRTNWPGLFPDSRQVAPAFATARFRIQAAIARRDHSPNKAVVHLVWAGTDRGGTFTDLRITDWHFTRTIKKGAATWMPQPRT
ncbi:hypothetical protein ACQPXS_46255 [Streptomyces sp. CA-142005]|uniref:hypothetical protein n=1 Tax=Streptomyces sp. CA-142005 TaxID=3240052 RepID=UPI003D8B9CE2